MHKEQKQFCEGVRDLFPHFFENVTVLDVGSQDVNGNNRYLFKNSEYTGLDLQPGRNVDITMPVHEYWKNSLVWYDVVISTEMLEHDMHWKESLKAMYNLSTKLLVFTAASTTRAEHGTRRSDPYASPFTTDYYMNIEPKHIWEAFSGLDFKEHRVIQSNDFSDIYFYGIK